MQRFVFEDRCFLERGRRGEIRLLIYCEMGLEFICCMLHPSDMLDYGVQNQSASWGILPVESSVINVNIVCEGTD
jgi:hypothetical protein